MVERLIVVGASYLQVPLLEKAAAMGIETHAFAWEEGAVGRDVAHAYHPISVVETAEILRVVRDIEPSGVVSIASDVTMPTVTAIAREFGLVGNSPECTAATTDKLLMRQSLQRAGLPVPRFRAITAPDRGVPPGLTFPLVVKPVDRSGSLGVTRVDDESRFGDAVEQALAHSLNGEAIVEEFVEGTELSVETISWHGRHHYLSCTDKMTTGPPHYIETGHDQPASLNADAEQRVVETVSQALDALGVEHGAAHSEVRVGAAGEIGIIEIGARMGGDFIGTDLVRLSTGYDYLEGVIEIALGRFSEPRKTQRKHAGVRFLHGRNPGRVARIVNHSREYDQVVRAEIGVAVGDTVVQAESSGDRIGYYIYQTEQERFDIPVDRVVDIVLS